METSGSPSSPVTGSVVSRRRALSRIPDPGSNNNLLAITAGPDGNLWFTEARRGGIGTVTAAAIQSSPSSARSRLSWGIAAGPDGNLWFADSANPGAIGRITTAGTILTPFTTGLTTNGTPLDITSGTDGKLYFSESAAAARSGASRPPVSSRNFKTGLSAAPSGIAAGSDGNIWFTEGAGNRVGRLTVAPDATTAQRPASTTPMQRSPAPSRPVPRRRRYHFDWGLTTAYGASTAEAPAGSGAAPVAVTAAIAGLAPSSLYHFRVVATNGAGTTTGGDGTFTTGVAPPTVTPPFGLPPATRPVFGQSAKISTVSGACSSTCRAERTTCRLLASTVPVGTTIDARAGTVRLTNVRDRSGKLQTGKFWGGSFIVRQSRAKRAPTVLTLAAPIDCSRAPASAAPKKGTRAPVVGERQPRTLRDARTIRSRNRARNRLVHAGHVRRHPREVTRGSVSVRDLVKHRTVVVTAGRSYLARVR